MTTWESSAFCETCRNTTEGTCEERMGFRYDSPEYCPDCGECWDEPFHPENPLADDTAMKEWLDDWTTECNECEVDLWFVGAEEFRKGKRHRAWWACPKCGLLLDKDFNTVEVGREQVAV